MTKQMKNLFDIVAENQVKYHITGGDFDNRIEVQHETKSGTTVEYIAQRDYSAKGLSYSIWKTTCSIAKGFKEEYLGFTHGFGRETVNFHEL